MDTEDDFRELLKNVYAARGVDFHLYKERILKRRIQIRLRKSGCRNYQEYREYLNTHHDEYRHLIDEIAVNVTEFFRNPDTFAIIEEQIIPEILHSKTAQKVRVWCVGVSSGEEAYSIAILFKEALEKYGGAFSVEIIATDIDQTCLLKAQAGVYQASGMSGVNAKRRAQYFDMREGTYTIKDEIKKLITFKMHNVIEDQPLKNLDLIVCRHVIMYFQREAQEKVCALFWEALKKGGFLVLGKVETCWRLPHEIGAVFDQRQRIYRKN